MHRPWHRFYFALVEDSWIRRFSLRNKSLFCCVLFSRAQAIALGIYKILWSPDVAAPTIIFPPAPNRTSSP